MKGEIENKKSKQNRMLAWGSGAAGLCALALAVLPYTLLKTFLDGLAGDGNAEVFTPLLHSGLRWVPGAAGVFLLAFGAVLWLRPQTLNWLKREGQQVGPDLRRLARDCNSAQVPRQERWVLAGIMLVYILLAVMLSLRIPLRYDEAYTYMEFARHSFGQVISDYHVVNNHLFHTVLVYVSTRLFGSGWLAIRLPALTAGLLLLPSLYALGRGMYNAKTGLAAAGWFAISPVFMLYVTSARGYTWVMLFTVWTLLLALRLQAGTDRAAWLLLVGCGALGVWTIPVMAYPLGGVYLWLLAQAVFQRPAGVTFLRRLIGLAVSGMAMVALALVLYTPAFGKDWVAGFLMRSTLQKLAPAEFYARLWGWVKAPFIEWLAGFPPVVIGIMLAGAALCVLLHWRFSRWRVPLQAAVFVTLGVILVVQRPEPLTRMWSWMAPLFFLTSTAGLLGGLMLLFEKREGALRVIPAAVLGVGMMLSGWALLDQTVPLSQPPGYDAPQVTAYLETVLTPDDVVVVTPHIDALYWYTFDQGGLPETAIRGIKQRPFRRALVVVYPGGRETLENVLEWVGPDAAFLNMDTVTLLQRFPQAELYAVEARHELVEDAFQLTGN